MKIASIFKTSVSQLARCDKMKKKSSEMGWRQMAIIEIAGYQKYYGKSRGLENADLCVEAGEIFGFIGPNGAGKTTLIRLLLGLIQPTKGKASVMGLEAGKDSAKINLAVGYLPGEAFFFPEMKGIDVIRFFQNMHHVDAKKYQELVELLEFDVNKRVSEYSFGNRKKLGIILAMLHEPKLLILDEPTSGLDPLMQQTFLELLAKEKEKGVTIFLSSHVLSEVEKVCDRIALIREGVVSHPYTISEIRSQSHKRVSLSQELPQPLLAGLRYLVFEKGQAHYDYQGDVNLLIRYLAQFDFANASIRDQSLEEIFLHYYKEGIERWNFLTGIYFF